MTRRINPAAHIDLVARKQKVGREDADEIELRILICLDAAKRSLLPAAGANFLTRHLIIASYIATVAKNKAFHARVTEGYEQLRKASDRPTALLDLTTGEHLVLCKAFRPYVEALPQVELGILAAAEQYVDSVWNP